MVLFRHADAPVKLDVDVRVHHGRAVREMLGGVEMDVRVRSALLEGRRGAPELTACGLRAQRHVRARVSDGLVGADLAAERFPHLRVLHDQVEGALRDTHLHGGDTELPEAPDVAIRRRRDRPRGATDDRAHPGRGIEARTRGRLDRGHVEQPRAVALDVQRERGVVRAQQP